MCRVAVEWHVLVEQGFQGDFHVLLGLVAIKRRFNLAEDYLEGRVSRGYQTRAGGVQLP